MSNDLAVLEDQLTTLAPSFEEVLRGSGLPPERVIRTILFSCEKLPKLLECNRQSVINAAMSFACLQLECDGATGQGYMLPFKQRAQPVVGYKGYNTLAGRSGFTINAAIVREDDDFVFELGTAPKINHRPKLGSDARIIGAYAIAFSKTRPPIVPAPLSIDEIMDIKNKAPGGGKSDSPWNDPTIGFPAMAMKSAMRRLARFMPLNLMVTADAMEQAHEVSGAASYIHPDQGVIIEGAANVETADEAKPKTEKPRFVVIDADGNSHDRQTFEQWRGTVSMLAARFQSGPQTAEFIERMDPVFKDLAGDYPEEIRSVLSDLRALRDQFGDIS